MAAGVPKAYDGLGRPRRKQITEGATTKEVVWTWDPAIGNGKGELGSISYGTTTVSYTGYDSLGRVTAHKQRTDNVDYPFTYSYFRNDAVATIGYPSGKVVTYTVDSAGRPLTALAPGKQYVTAAKYAGHGGLRQLVMAGTNLDVSNTYNGQLQTEEIFVRKMPATSTLLKLQYDYHVSATTENNGNPREQRIDDGVTTRTQNYGFDAANRVSTMTEVGGASMTFNYDAYNNRWVTVPGGSPGHAAATVSAQSAYNAATNRFVTAAMAEGYDAAGHTTVMEGGVITSDWDSEGNRIKSTNQSYTPTYYVFDGLGQRVKKENEYWGTYVHVYDAFGRLAPEYGAGVNGECTTCYPIEDTVGSTRLVANENGDAVQRFDYTPFGPTLSSSDGTWANGRAGTAWDSSTIVLQQYAGMHRDVLGLEGSGDFVGARVFKRSLGRFWSPDENLTDQNAADPLSWNLYTYARNNPLIYVDPTGRCSKAADGTGYVDTGDELFSGPCSGGVIGDTPVKNPNSATVNEIAPPSPLLLAVASGAQRAESSVNLAGAGTAVVVGGAFAGMAYGAWAGGSEIAAGWFNALEGHHPIARFLGGNLKQPLSSIPRAIHRQFHALLRQELKKAGIPLNVGGRGGSIADWANFMRANPGAQKTAFEAVARASKAIDAKFGTQIAQEFAKNVASGAFK